MIRAVVTGNVWSTRRIDGLPPGAFLEVETEDGATRLVAFDVLGSGVGERVLIAQGSVAAAWFPGAPPPVDALVIGSIDPPGPTSTPTDLAPTTGRPSTPSRARRAGAHPQEKQ